MSSLRTCLLLFAPIVSFAVSPSWPALASADPADAAVTAHEEYEEDQEEEGDQADYQSEGGGSCTTVIKEQVVAPASYTDEYLSDVAARMGKGQVGQTTPSWSWVYQTDKAGKVKSCTVTLTISIRLARWSHLGKRTKADTEWKRFIKALEQHEGEHVQIIRRALGDMGSLAVGLTPSKAEEAFRRAVAKQAADHARYDQETGHGETEGAVLDGSKDPRPGQQDHQEDEHQSEDWE